MRPLCDLCEAYLPENTIRHPKRIFVCRDCQHLAKRQQLLRQRAIFIGVALMGSFVSGNLLLYFWTQ